MGPCEICDGAVSRRINKGPVWPCTFLPRRNAIGLENASSNPKQHFSWKALWNHEQLPRLILATKAPSNHIKKIYIYIYKHTK